MKILVTGALGHIGSRLIRALPRAGYNPELVLVDNLATQRYASLFNLPAGTSYQFVEADVLTADLAPLLRGVDAVIHLAAITDAAGSFDQAEKVERVNFDGTKRVAEACAAAGCALVFLSTTSVYGTQAEVVDETCTPDELKPQSPYARSKLAGEQMVQEMCASAGLRAVILRFGTIFGTSIGMRFHTAVNKFCWQAIMGQPITVWRTALHQRRPYLDLGDAVEALHLVLRDQIFDGRVYNVVTANATVHEVVEAIRRDVPSLGIVEVDSQIMNQLSYAVSSERFRAKGFEYRGDMAAGIRETLQWLSNANTRGGTT